MTTSQTSSLSKPVAGTRVEPWTLAYFQARNRSRAHELVLAEFEKSGINQAELARRLGKQPAVVSRLLGAPGNWGLDTLSDLLFAIDGAEVKYNVQYPLDGAPRNYSRPDWCELSQGGTTASNSVTLHVFQQGFVEPTSVASPKVKKADALDVSAG